MPTISSFFSYPLVTPITMLAIRVRVRPCNERDVRSSFGRVTTREVELICGLAGPRASAELFKLSEQWRLRPVWCLTGYMWEAA